MSDETMTTVPTPPAPTTSATPETPTRRPRRRADVEKRHTPVPVLVRIVELDDDDGEGWTYVKGTSAAEKEVIEAECLIPDASKPNGLRQDYTRFKLSTVQAGWYETETTRMYVGPEGRKELGAVATELVDAVFVEIQKLNGVTAADGASAAVGNSVPVLSDAK